MLTFKELCHNRVGLEVFPSSFERAKSAYSLGLLGVYSKSHGELDAALHELGASPLTEALQARVLFLSGSLARGMPDAEMAQKQLVDAASKFAVQGETHWASLSFALATEILCSSGQIDRARKVIELWSDNSRASPSIAPDLARSIYHWAKGNFEEARSLLKVASEMFVSETYSLWLQTFMFSAEVEIGNWREVSSQVEKQVKLLKKVGRREELYLRSLLLWGEIQFDQAVDSEEQRVTLLHLCRGTLKELEAYAISWPRYFWSAKILQALLFALEGDAKASLLLHEGQQGLRECGALLDLGRWSARFASFQYDQSTRASRAYIAHARDVLSRAGADERSMALSRLEGGRGDFRASTMGNQSMLGRSMMMGAVPGKDDVELAAVFEVNRIISSSLKLGEVLDAIVSQVSKTLKAERVAILQANDLGQLTCVAATGLVASRATEGEISLSILAEVDRQGQVVLTDNAQIDERFRGKASVLASEIRSLMCAPLKAPSGHLGYLYVDSTVKARIFTPAHSELLQVFATQAAIAIDNAATFSRIEDLNSTLEARVELRTAELSSANAKLMESLDVIRNTQLKLAEAQREAYEKEILLAREIQQGILPKAELIQRPGVKLFGLVEPASHVGGDFWCDLSLPNNRTLVLVGDVTGHGVGAGMVTTAAKACCLTLSCQGTVGEISEFLVTLSKVIAQSTQSRLTMTACAVLIDPAKKEFTVAAAGHPFPLLIRHASGLPQVSPILVKGPTLGAEAGEAVFQLYTSQYEPKDRLFFYTDGLLEGVNVKGTPLGLRRLTKLLHTHAMLPLTEQTTAVVSGATAFFGDTPRDDDITYVWCEFDG